jgi:hypothetical protein
MSQCCIAALLQAGIAEPHRNLDGKKEGMKEGEAGRYVDVVSGLLLLSVMLATDAVLVVCCVCVVCVLCVCCVSGRVCGILTVRRLCTPPPCSIESR